MPKATKDEQKVGDENQAKLVQKRAVLKRRITISFDNYDPTSSFSVFESVIKGYLAEIKVYDERITSLILDSSGYSELFSDDTEKELENQSKYTLSILTRLSNLSSRNLDVEQSVSLPANDLKLPELKCTCFSGEGTSHLDYHAFITQFRNIIDSRNISNISKLTYLRSYLSGYALKIVQHLQLSQDNYAVALRLLDDEFLNPDAIINDLYTKLLKLKPKSDSSHMETKLFINEVRCIISDLRNYDINLLENHSANTLISHIIISKLPNDFKQELVRKLDNNYPTIENIFENYADVITTLNLNFASSVRNVRTNDSSYSNSKPIIKASNFNSRPPRNYNSKFDGKPRNLFCKFCNANGHCMLKCSRYVKFHERRARCEELNICSKCTSSKHDAHNCKTALDFSCSICKSFNHISAMCPNSSSRVNTNFSLNTSSDSGKTFILPTLSVTVGSGRYKTKVRCLVDTGSQRSYVSNKVLDRLHFQCKSETKLLINTFLDSDFKTFGETCLNVDFGDRSKDKVFPFLISKDVELSYTVDGLKLAHDNVSKHLKLAEQFSSDEVKLEGLLGIDAIQLLSDYKLVQCLNGQAIEFSSGLVPIGNVDSFLTEKQLVNKYQVKKSGKVDQTVNSSLVNFLIDPISTMFDPIGSVVDDSLVDRKLDNMFNLNSLGIKETFTDYDQYHLDKFDSQIEFNNGYYEVSLPWTDKIADVKSNYNVAKSVLDRVLVNLDENKMYDKYNAVLKQQLDDGIIEQIPLSDVSNKIWIPHRPVVKTEDNVTTKLRIVLNCSLKGKDSPSLNESAYPGVDLLSNLLELLIKIRNNKYLVISDIKQAFLMIKLKEEFDRNKFCILWRNAAGELVAYRYKTIVFGYASSPFILLHVIKHHVAKYELDECSHILNNNLYVDNLFFTGNDINSLTELYSETLKRMREGGFNLRSWASNCEPLNALFEANGDSVGHSSEYEKVLGYRYHTATDSLSLPPVEQHSNSVVTKRLVLSGIAQVFDPLGLYSPVLVKGKILLQDLWKDKLDWDEPVSEMYSKRWNCIKTDFSRLHEIGFGRQVYDDDCELFIFCDSSKSVYGFSCYCKGEIDGVTQSNLLFAKAKNAPTKSKSIPTLELLSVFLAMKCLPTILNSMQNKVKNVTLCVDAQIVLSWILSKNVKSKNIFAKNRVKDISGFREEYYNKFNLQCKFKYVPTLENPADLLTRGISVKEFLTKLKFWQNGPTFLLGQPGDAWPDDSLGCLSQEVKIMTKTVVISSLEPLLPIDKYSDVNKLIRVTSLVFSFLSKLRKQNCKIEDSVNKAKCYWIKYEQANHFEADLEFLKFPKDNSVPNRVANFNLFLDSENIIRSRGRYERCLEMSYDRCNPVLLPKQSKLTKLIILDAHENCKHLGVPSTINNVRKMGYWIPQIRNLVKAYLSKCIVCKKINQFAFKYPKQTDFNKDKVNFQKPFNHTGIDFTGHVYVKFGDNSTKMYLLVFTCLNIRAIHIELLPSMTCKDFLLAFTRFCNMYGIPNSIYSDNASTFLQAMGIISHSHVDNDFSSYLIKNSIKHVRIPLYSAWVGSAWERMIRTIKSCLYKTLGRKHYEYFTLLTLLSDIVNSINSRPLTYLDSTDLSVLTPNCFIKSDSGRSVIFGHTGGSELSVPYRKDLVKALELREDMFSRFKDMWIDEYLPSLRENSRDLYQKDWENLVKLGDVVLISSSVKPRSHWQLGRVVALSPSGDGKVRSVTLKKADGTEAVHSINLLHPLEISAEDTTRHSTGLAAPTVDNRRKSKRLAARKAIVNCF